MASNEHRSRYDRLIMVALVAAILGLLSAGIGMMIF
jgi:hypothetical protein